jgi:hypothetical protein
LSSSSRKVTKRDDRVLSRRIARNHRRQLRHQRRSVTVDQATPLRWPAQRSVSQS